MNMIEKVARAIAKANDDNMHWKGFIPEAKAAIEAMREPTEEMTNREGYHDNCYTCGGHLEGYQCMIDAALKE